MLLSGRVVADVARMDHGYYIWMDQGLYARFCGFFETQLKHVF